MCDNKNIARRILTIDFESDRSESLPKSVDRRLAVQTSAVVAGRRNEVDGRTFADDQQTPKSGLRPAQSDAGGCC